MSQRRVDRGLVARGAVRVEPAPRLGLDRMVDPEAL